MGFLLVRLLSPTSGRWARATISRPNAPSGVWLIHDSPPTVFDDKFWRVPRNRPPAVSACAPVLPSPDVFVIEDAVDPPAPVKRVRPTLDPRQVMSTRTGHGTAAAAGVPLQQWTIPLHLTTHQRPHRLLGPPFADPVGRHQSRTPSLPNLSSKLPRYRSVPMSHPQRRPLSRCWAQTLYHILGRLLTTLPSPPPNWIFANRWSDILTRLGSRTAQRASVRRRYSIPYLGRTAGAPLWVS